MTNAFMPDEPARQTVQGTVYQNDPRDGVEAPKPSHLDRLKDMLAEAETDLKTAVSRHDAATEELHAAESAVETAKEVTDILRTAVEKLTPPEEPETVAAEENLGRELTVADWITLHLETYGPATSLDVRTRLVNEQNYHDPAPSAQKVRAILKADERFRKDLRGYWHLTQEKTNGK
jgi:hypothetical protein